MIAATDLTASHLADLTALAANPRHRLQPQRRKLLVRLGLIQPCEEKHGPSASGDEYRLQKRFPARMHELTDAGRAAIEPKEAA